MVRMWAAALMIALVVSGCSPPGLAGQPTATPTLTPTVPPSPTLRPTARPTPKPRPSATPRVVVGKPYAHFLHALCGDLARGNTGAVIAKLAHYQYNSGIRYGYLGDGEGQTGGPALLRRWLSHSRVRCAAYTPGVEGHGLLLTSGWPLRRGSWSLIELDTFSGQWRINDFTFGSRTALAQVMRVGLPVIRYH